ncbi:hypothetical protein PIROE2DRAFT_57499 [Piromyces sp. E2]|nr:hypothetical protein PIROE2DRAFT_57499 [Piromyces sp. E2]|eukprot:OUM69282.1 hypothetical protein PIROE2DRAFT_57499 [Piromyces sp. E2]
MIIQKFNVISNSLIIRDSNDVDLNNTNNIIKDILNYPELQRNNKYVVTKPLPNDSSNLTVDFFIRNNITVSSKRNSLKGNNLHNGIIVKGNTSPFKTKPLLDTNIKTKPLNGNKSNISIEITGNSKPPIEKKKFVLPVNDTEWYKNVYYKEVYSSIDEINFEQLISEDQTKEKNESYLFHTTSEQIKKNKNNLLDQFKYNNINQFGKQTHNKPIIKNSIEILNGSNKKVNGGKALSIKSDQSSINSNKSKISKNSVTSSIKSDNSYTPQKYKKLGGDEKINLKPKMIGNSGNGKYIIIDI